MTKQTAANNKFLATVKHEWNSKIYKKALILVNTEGEEAARKFVQQFTTVKLEY